MNIKNGLGHTIKQELSCCIAYQRSIHIFSRYDFECV